MAESAGEAFGVVLRRLRRAAGLTQEELAERADTSPRTVSDIERGVSTAPYRATIDALAAALELTEVQRAELHAAGSRRRRSKGAEPSTHSGGLLPEQPNVLLGRERDEAEVLHALRFEGARMVTITGAGGVGKTRLGLRVAERMRTDVATIWFVPLAALDDPAQVPGRIASVLDVMLDGSVAAEEALARALQSARALLVLDNVEQVAAIGSYLARLLERSLELRILVTSREPLRIRAEREYPLSPLALPDLERLPGEDRLGAYPSVALFVDRARAVKPEFRLTRENARVVAEICTKLDGLPLAIELAAAWIRTLSPHALLLRLDHPLRILRDGPQDLPSRQQTMRDAIAWSYGLLGASDALLFRHLSIFAGGASLEAVESVCDGASDDLLSGLSALTAKSLIVAAPTDEDGGLRWSMLQTIRDYAAEQLDVSGEAHAVRKRHRDYYRSLVGRGNAGLYDREQDRWIRILEGERDNLWEAFAWSLETPGEQRVALEMASDLGVYWQIRGHLEEGARWFARALEECRQVEGEPFAVALNYAANVENLCGHYDRASELYTQALTRFRELGMIRNATTVLGNLAVLAEWQQRNDQAHRLYEEALAGHRELGDREGVARTLLNWVQIVADDGRWDQADAMIKEALEFYETRGDTRNIGGCFSMLGYVAGLRGEVERSLALHRTALQRFHEVGVYSDLVGELEIVAQALDDPAAAVRILAAAGEFRETIGRPLPPSEREAAEENIASFRATLGPHDFERAWNEGRALTIEAAVDLALGCGVDAARPPRQASTGHSR